MSQGHIYVPARGESKRIVSVSMIGERKARQGENEETDCLRGDNVVSLFLVESGYALDHHVVALCRARGEDDVLFFCSNKVRYVLSKCGVSTGYS